MAMLRGLALVLGWLWLSKWDPILGFSECTTHFRTYFSGDWDAHWGITGILTHGQLRANFPSPGVGNEPVLGIPKERKQLRNGPGFWE